MKNAEIIKYLPGIVKVAKKSGGWFATTQEFLMYPGDSLTLVPVSRPRQLGPLRKLWLVFAPNIWRKHKRKKAFKKFLDANRVTDPNLREFFGTNSHIASEKMRVLGLPPIDVNDFDCRRRSKFERQHTLDTIIRAAIKEHSS